MDALDKSESEELGSQMSFLDHLDELRRRLVNSVIILVIAFIACWFASQAIFNFLSIPIRKALSEAQRREVPVIGRTGDEAVRPLSSLREGDTGRYIFSEATKLGTGVVQPGASVNSIVVTDTDGQLSLFTDEPIYTNSSVIPKGVRLPVDLGPNAENPGSTDEKLIVQTAQENFTLYVTVSLYTAIAVSLPLLLIQVWGFISPALYKHERSYVTPFVVLSSISFVGGAAFAYYILFPPAVSYLLSLGADFRQLLRATDYFDLITIIMLAMGLIFQMPAISYVLARIGIVTPRLMIKSWKIALIVILIVAAVVSPTGDIPNMMLFATPMMVLYVVSILIAWIFGKKRVSDSGEAGA
ncbi:MAG: twin-arginine translocase subunit TatC [Acidobacteria bacterium]|nr:twin-arginine translocase subunit TatC [Acidobacteriota bacterium]